MEFQDGPMIHVFSIYIIQHRNLVARRYKYIIEDVRCLKSSSPLTCMSHQMTETALMGVCNAT
jgi:hypothetical protein